MPKFDRDIILANDDGKVYHITQEVLEKLEAVDLNSSRYELIKALLKDGCSSAMIPEYDSTPQPDVVCYLLNLASLKWDTPYTKE